MGSVIKTVNGRL